MVYDPKPITPKEAAKLVDTTEHPEYWQEKKPEVKKGSVWSGRDKAESFKMEVAADRGRRRAEDKESEKVMKPIRSDNAMTALRNLHKSINDLNELIKSRTQSMSQRAVKTGDKTRANLVQHVREHGNTRDNYNSPTDRDIASDRAQRRSGEFGKALPKHLKKIADSTRAPKGSEEREDEDSYLKEHMGNKFEKGVPHGNERWDKQVEPKEDFDRREAHIANRNIRREKIRSEIRADPAFGKSEEKMEPITHEDMVNLSKSLLGLREIVKSSTEILKGTLKQNRAGRGNLRGMGDFAGGHMPKKSDYKEAKESGMVGHGYSRSETLRPTGRRLDKAEVPVMGRGPQKKDLSSMGRNYKKPEPKKKEADPTWA